MHSALAVNTTRQQEYAHRFNPVLDFIDRHLDEPLPVDRLSRPAHFSKLGEVKAMQVKIVEVEPVTVAALEHRGSPASLEESVQRFIAWRRETGLSPVATRRTYGIAYDDPQTAPPEEFRFDVCGEVSVAVPPNAHGVVTKVIPGGRCAVVRHSGSPDHIAGSVHHLYRTWLPQSGEEPRDFPIYFHYLNLRQDTAEHELLTDVHLPLK